MAYSSSVMRLGTKLFFLFILGATVDGIDMDNNTPLHIAARYGHKLLINALLENKADPNK